jgi:hypothetical protein
MGYLRLAFEFEFRKQSVARLISIISLYDAGAVVERTINIDSNVQVPVMQR